MIRPSPAGLGFGGLGVLGFRGLGSQEDAKFQALLGGSRGLRK